MTSNPGIQAIGSLARYLGLSTLDDATSNPDIQAIGSWARYVGLNTMTEGPLATNRPDMQAIGSWARYIGSVLWLRYPWRRAILIYRLLAAGLGRCPGLSNIQAVGSWAGYLGLGTLA